MICCKTFNNYEVTHFESYSRWIDFVNDNYKYAQTESKVFDWVGKCDRTGLISSHPYWKYLTQYRELKDLLVRQKRVLSDIKDCPEDGTEGAMRGVFCNAAVSALMGTPHSKNVALKKLNTSINAITCLIITFAKNYK